MSATQPMPARRQALRVPPVKPARRQDPAPVDYPESDGKPMSETPVHWHATVDFAQPLMDRYAERPDSYVGSDMLMYWEEGKIEKRVSPDVFVAFGPNKEPERRVWKVWEEGTAADFVLEVTSNSTQGRDEGFKAELYARLKVTEYWQFDPTEDYLSPSLKGRRLNADGAYEPIPLERRDGQPWGFSEVLGLELRPDGQALRLFDPAGGEFLPRFREKSRMADAAQAQRDTANAERDAANAERDAVLAAHRVEAEARRVAEARIAELERRLAEADE